MENLLVVSPDKSHPLEDWRGDRWILSTDFRDYFLILPYSLIIMNKSQELTVFHGRQKLTSAKN